MELLLIGLNHRTASLELRERVAFSAEQAQRAAEEMRAQGIAEEAVVLSTCNRSELYAVPAGSVVDAGGAIGAYFAGFHQISPAELNGSLYRYRDGEVARHLFRVAAGLDSMMLGEAEILGQVRDAYRRALDRGATGPALNRLFQGALEVGKRVRAETELGARPMSVAFAGVKLAERVFGRLNGHHALIVGAGEMGQQVVEQIRDRGIERLLVANRSRERGQELARRVGGEAVEWESLSATLELPDVVVTSVSGAERILTRAMLERAMAARGNRPMFLIDLGVPRNVEAAVAELYNVYLYNIDDLAGIVEQNKNAREREIPRAESIIAEHVSRFEAWQAGLHALALIDHLRIKLEGQRREFLRERLETLHHLSPEDRQQVARLTEELLDEILKEPADRLRHAHKLGQKLQAIEVVRKLFGLNREES